MDNNCVSFYRSLIIIFSVLHVECTKQLTTSFNPNSLLTRNCILRIIFPDFIYETENQITPFLETTSQIPETAIILEAEPNWRIRRKRFRGFKVTKFYSTQQLSPKFIQRYIIFIFQDQLISSFAKHEKEIPPQYYFRYTLNSPLVYWRNENPTAVIFVTYQPHVNVEIYKQLHAVYITSTYLLFYKNCIWYLICETCATFFHVLEDTDLENTKLNKIWHNVHRTNGAYISFAGILSNERWDFRDAHACDFSWKRRYFF